MRRQQLLQHLSSAGASTASVAASKLIQNYVSPKVKNLTFRGPPHDPLGSTDVSGHLLDHVISGAVHTADGRQYYNQSYTIDFDCYLG